MISKPSFDDRSLAQSFYQTLLNRFCESFQSPISSILCECNFGIAPSPKGEKTFFIITPSLDTAEQLTQNIDIIISKVNKWIPRITQTAICIVPPKSQEDYRDETNKQKQLPSKFMLGKVFRHNRESY
ncbi:MAG: hypothetical protein N3E45_04730 [Oscillatoriaceae bacterium SKW80]|nr:hypothetical protein [Oscillatoriaceae bacterium SKYG93]MCX8120122.1 hypothetical protein [Oscillatoriaceae bacterium SKW80]MDW8453048.1 hypothetical protein [Oscillatoriaceae cyanobacterium SKYGB_i_bin93]HIK29041.1 hypothetical protein [Oscillatoriaceae cyanobacterium M7585_C2015_266]